MNIIKIYLIFFILFYINSSYEKNFQSNQIYSAYFEEITNTWKIEKGKQGNN